MNNCYFELRKTAMQNAAGLAVDIMQHVHTREYLGKSIIVCEYPTIFLATAYKQWLRLSQDVQLQRTVTLETDKILKYTHLITHMQHMRFTTKTPLEEPRANLYFLRPDQLAAVPPQCFSVYITVRVATPSLTQLLEQLPEAALIVDYCEGAKSWQALGLQPKRALEAYISSEWRRVEQFLAAHHVKADELFEDSFYSLGAMDDALDSLLAHSHQFLRVADDFCHALELARPLRVRQNLRRQYDALALLAHHVQSLSGQTFTKRFLEMYSEDDSQLPQDTAQKRTRQNATIDSLGEEGLAQTVVQHLAAGRRHLTEALGMFAVTSQIFS